MFSRDELDRHFRSLGVASGDTVMLHASVRAVGEIAGGPDQIHLALKDALTSEGTLIMYASCPQYTDEVGRGNLTPEQEQEVLEKLPRFRSFDRKITARERRARRQCGKFCLFCSGAHGLCAAQNGFNCNGRITRWQAAMTAAMSLARA